MGRIFLGMLEVAEHHEVDAGSVDEQRPAAELLDASALGAARVQHQGHSLVPMHQRELSRRG
jgi:hypothetical protein